MTTYKLAADHWPKLNISWDYMILDEAHYIKDPKTTRYSSLSSIHSIHKILMTGTPAPNGLQVHTLISAVNSSDQFKFGARNKLSCVFFLGNVRVNFLLLKLPFS